MAKKKSSKESETKSFQYSVELTGLLLVLIGLIGFGFGPVGALIKKFALFLVGEWWPIILVTILVLGVHMIIKRKLPKFFTSRLVGFYLLVIVILVFSHFEFIKNCEKSTDILKVTLDNYMDRISSITSTAGLAASGSTSIVIGGGILGALFSLAFASLFGQTGTIIVLVILAIFGIIMLFNINFGELMNSLLAKLRAIGSKAKREFHSDEEDDEREMDDKVVITSVEELKNYHEQPKEVQREEQVSLTPVADAPIQVPTNATYHLPPLSLLDELKKPGKINSNDFTRANKTVLERVLNDFQIKGTVVEIHVGPTVTQYEVSIPAGTKVSRILSINKEIALAMAAKDVRIEAPIPGKNTVGIELPNPVIQSVQFKDVMMTIPKDQLGAKLLVCLGKDIMGRTQTADLNKMPHLLVAGATGSGKSVCINTFIISLLMRYRPDEVKIVLVDPKKVELSNYNGVPHLLCPVVTDPKKANVALQRIVAEMDRRYNEFSDRGVKNISGYNEWVEKENKKHPETPIKKMNYIVVIIDELADLMLVAAKEVEESIMRITQMARAAGIHLIVATQRPSTDVITGVVKANIPSRIAFTVSSQIDSRTILDHPGAEKLLGKGDMLYSPMGSTAPLRIQGCFISDGEIERVIEYVCKEQIAQYDNSILEAPTESHMAGEGGEVEEYDDPLYNEIVEFAIKTGKISASLLQRRFRLGYNRAARIVDLLEERGIIGPQNGSKPREVLVKLEGAEKEEE